MNGKGYIVIQNTAPRGPRGEYEEYIAAVWKLIREFEPQGRAAGMLGWRVLSDQLPNTPANISIWEFATPEKAMEYLISAECRTFFEKMRNLGALDMRVSAYRTWAEG